MTVHVKICGLSEPESIRTAIDGGAAYLGFVFYPPSPRFVTVNTARRLSENIPHTIQKVGVFVDPDDALLEAACGAGMDILQLHGAESVERVKAIREQFQKPVIKAFKIAGAPDFLSVADYEAHIDFLMFDTKSATSALPGGTGESFDWLILKDRSFSRPWFLSGGLKLDNIKAAIHITGAKLIDVSSGVEKAPGRKSPDQVRAFLKTTMDMA